MTDTESNNFTDNKMSRSLTSITLLKGLSAEERSALERECKWRRYQNGELLFSHGSLGSEVFFLIDGEFRILGVATSGQEFTLAHVEAGETIGEMAAIDARPRSASVVASQNSLVAILNGDRFLDVVRQHGEIGVALLKRLSSMVRTGDDSVIELRVHNERMETELNIARKIQMSMVPMVFPAFPNRSEFTVFAVLEPAREVGGDFYDFFFIDEDRFCICIGDVSGKGVPAALFMAVAKTLIRSRATEDSSTASILTHVNDELSADNKECMFVTLFIGIVNIMSGNVVYTNAGHNPPYIRRQNGKLLSLGERHGPIIGALEGMVYGENRVKLDPADILLLYTDGVTEAMDSENNLFSDERLLNLLETTDVDSVENVVKDIVAAVETFEDGVAQTDDVTVLAFQYHGSSEASAMAELQISIKNDLSEIAKINEAFEAFAAEHGLPTPITKKFSLIFEELLNNVISYACRDEDDHEISTRVEFVAGRLTVTIADDGVPFNPLSAKTPDTEPSLKDREIGGLGIHLVRSLVDDVSYHRGIDKNVLTLVKQLDSDDV